MTSPGGDKTVSMAGGAPHDSFDEIPVRDASGQFSLIGQQAASTSQAAAPSSTAPHPDQQVDAIVAKLRAGISAGGDQELIDRRLRNAVMINLKGVRTDQQTRETLTKAVASGGLGLDAAAADMVLAIIAAHKKKGQPSPEVKPVASPSPALHKISLQELRHELAPPAPVVKKSTQSPPDQPPAKKTVAAAQPKQQTHTAPPSSPPPKPKPAPPQGRSAIESLIPKKSAAASPSPTPAPAKPAAPQPSTPPTKPVPRRAKQQSPAKPFIDRPLPSTSVAASKKESAVPSPTAQPVPRKQPPAKPQQVTRAQAPAAAGKKITDVHAPTQLVGPVEEFRALNSDPAKAIVKIKEKIDLLERESFGQRVAAVEAWRTSQVHRLYLAIAADSMAAGQPVDQTIAQRKKEQRPFVSAEEFRALGKLSSMIEY